MEVILKINTQVNACNGIIALLIAKSVIFLNN